MILTTMMLAATMAAGQAQDFSWQGDLRAGQELKIGNLIGTVRIEPASGRRAEVTAVKRAGRRGDPRDVEIRAEESNDGVRICVRYPSDRGRREDWRCGDNQGGNTRNDPNDTRVDFTVRLPAGVRIDATTISGDILARDLSADAALVTISGDVRLDRFRGERLHAKAISGQLELADVDARDTDAQTISGNITYEGPLRRQGNYEFKSLSGRVTVTIPEGTGAELRASTFSGRIHFPEAQLSEVNIRRNNRATARLGNGGASLSVESFSGSVEVRYKR